MSNVIKFPKIFKPLNNAKRYKVMHGGRGSSKSWSVARKLILMGANKPLRILCTRELQKSIKQSVHKLLSDQISRMGLDAFYQVTDASIKGINGTEFIFMGVKHNPEEIKSTEGIDICWIEEAHSLTESSWDIIDPTIRKEGSEIWVTFNPRFKFDFIYQYFIVNDPPENSWVQEVSFPDNPFFPEPLRVQMERMAKEDYEKYEYVWLGKLKKLAEGAIFGTQIIEARRENRICAVPVLSGVEVHTFWDLGRNDHTAIWFMQNVGKEYRFIDYYENRLKDIEHYARVVKAKPYMYGTHYMPHDVEHIMLGMKSSRRQQFKEGGIDPIKTVDRVKVKSEGIESARRVFPSIWIDEKRCERGIECLSNYRYEYNDDRDTHNLAPHHDWASNGADAFMQFAQGYRDTKRATRRRPKQVSIA